MHVYFIGIGGAGIGPLAQIAHKAGYKVSGSDLKNSKYIDYLKDHGIENIQIGQSEELISNVHNSDPIDWVVYSSAVVSIDPNPGVLNYCLQNNIKSSKRDEFINKFLSDNDLKMVAVAGTHGKTTTTAMLVWLFKSFKEPISYLLPAKVNFAEMGDFDPSGKFFIYEADEFDHNFLAFSPLLSVITGVSWDHHEIFPTRADYKHAFSDFISQSSQALIWQDDANYLELANKNLELQYTDEPRIAQIKLKGLYNRRDGWMAASAASRALGKSLEECLRVLDEFPGLDRRMEEIYPNLYSDYAHTPEKIRGAMSAALEIANSKNQELVVVYEPLTNRRQIHMLNDYKDCFNGASKVYWLPSYLAREDPGDQIIEPSVLISRLDDPSIATPVELSDELKALLDNHLSEGHMVVCMAGGGGGSLDDWLREKFTN
jgi:UDP-N-acetylmuramate--alanine ligase